MLLSTILIRWRTIGRRFIPQTKTPTKWGLMLNYSYNGHFQIPLWRNWGIRGLQVLRKNQTKAEAAIPAAWIAPEAIGNPTVDDEVGPTPTAKNAIFS
jgi:hypothetical protein